MDKRELTIDYFLFPNRFPAEYENLCRKAIEASACSYSVYSEFAVGAALLLENGEIVTGSNQENAAYPSGMCAERTALFPDIPVRALAIAACYKGLPRENFVPPCGACRQVMAETIKRYNQDFDVVMIGQKESVMLKASALLPFAFSF